MKRILLAGFAIGMTMSSFAQDTTKIVITTPTDTIRIGGVTIIKEDDPNDSTDGNNISIGSRYKKKNPNVKTNWWVVDLGFSSFEDKTNYAETFAAGLTGAGINEETMELRAGKSVNVNIWAFQQKINLIKHVLNFQYGVGVELNNYRWDNKQVKFQKEPTNMIVLDGTYKDLDKNKLAADYLTVPVMLTLDFNPNGSKRFGFGGGMSIGYLYSARQKIKMGDDKDKVHGDFDLNKWKLSYIGELSLGYIKLYGSYALNSMWDNRINHTPYNVGFRLAH